MCNHSKALVSSAINETNVLPAAIEEIFQRLQAHRRSATRVNHRPQQQNTTTIDDERMSMIRTILHFQRGHATAKQVDTLEKKSSPCGFTLT
jgi:hypothetical protein